METKVTVKCLVFIATSLDGYIARSNGDLDWLSEGEQNTGNEDYGFQSFMDSVDAVVLGRNTFEKVLTFGEWPYTKKVVVLTGRPIELPDHLLNKVTVTSGSPRAITGEMSAGGFHHLYVDGGKTIQGFLKAGLIDEMIISRIPVIIGEGIPLFGPVEGDIKWKHISTTSYPNGMVQSKYRAM